MIKEARPPKARKPDVPLDVAQARAVIEGHLGKAAAKGSATLGAKAVISANQTTFEEALEGLEIEGQVVVDRSKAKPKYYLKEFAPSHKEKIVAKLRKAGAKGSSALWAASASANVREAIEKDAAKLESESVIVIDRASAKWKYYLAEFAPKTPSIEDVCERLEAFAESRYPEILSSLEVKKALDKSSSGFLEDALARLIAEARLIRLRRGKSVFFVSARALREALSGSAEPKAESAQPASEVHSKSTLDIPAPAGNGVVAFDSERVRAAYQALVDDSGIPSVKIETLRQDTGLPLPELQQWLLEEYHHGRAVLSFGDWSLSDEAARSAAIELRGERYLLVRLRE